jgi:GTP-binding protein
MKHLAFVFNRLDNFVGLGFEFLKHLSRAKALLHILDVLPADGSDPVKNFLTIEHELAK